MTEAQRQTAQLKEKYIEYYRDLPVQKYAAMYVGKDETTIINWKKKDSNFSNRVSEARAAWVRQKAKKAKVEFALERLEKEIFAERKEIKVEDETVNKILEGFGLVKQNQKTQRRSPKKRT